MLPERGYTWRTRSLGIGLVYFLYFVALVAALVIGANDDGAVRPALIVVITVASLHFGLGFYSMLFERGVVELTPDVQSLVELSDWMAAGALGAACDAVNRTHGDNRATMFASGILLAVAQCVCAYKTATFVSRSVYDQESGELLRAR